mgnify:CR=1 FL=1
MDINALNYCRKVCKYVIASPEYYIYSSVLETEALHKFNKNLILYSKKVIHEYIQNVRYF